MLHRSSETLIQAAPPTQAVRQCRDPEDDAVRQRTGLLQTVERSRGVENAVTSPQEVPFRLGTSIRTVQKIQRIWSFATALRGERSLCRVVLPSTMARDRLSGLAFCVGHGTQPLPEPSAGASSRTTPSPSSR